MKLFLIEREPFRCATAHENKLSASEEGMIETKNLAIVAVKVNLP